MLIVNPACFWQPSGCTASDHNFPGLAKMVERASLGISSRCQAIDALGKLAREMPIAGMLPGRTLCSFFATVQSLSVSWLLLPESACQAVAHIPIHVHTFRRLLFAVQSTRAASFIPLFVCSTIPLRPPRPPSSSRQRWTPCALCFANCEETTPFSCRWLAKP